MWKIKEDSSREVLLGVPTAAERIQLVRHKKQQGDIRRWIKRVQRKVVYLQHVAKVHQDIDQTDTVDLLNEPHLPPLPSQNQNPTDIGITGNIDLSWLPPKEDKEKDSGPGQKGVEERIAHDSSSSSGSSGSSSSSSSSVYSLFSSIGSSNFLFRDSDKQNSLSNESVVDKMTRWQHKETGGGLIKGMDAKCGEPSCYVFSACIYCTAGLITVGSLSFCCKLLNKNYF